mmetsp:Transcript_61319/g.102060  ORF Transcript_61319/g.102060 Transcript_61319/m.102060 type:complete len:211 (-) Transcript_61319:68-700(-)
MKLPQKSCELPSPASHSNSEESRRLRRNCRPRQHRRPPLTGMRLAKRRAQVRWNTFVGSPGSRLETCMLDRLGPKLWSDFVRHARRYRTAYIAAFMQPVLACTGTVDGKPCPHRFTVDFGDPEAGSRLESLHLDHETKVCETLLWWRSCLPAQPRAWDDGLDGGRLCHSLFGVCDHPVYGDRSVRFRCGPRKTKRLSVLRYSKHVYCHNS